MLGLYSGTARLLRSSKSVSGDTRELAIISPQGSGNERSRQYRFGGSVTIGYGGASINPTLDYASSKSEYRMVNAESGARATGFVGQDARGTALAADLAADNAAYNEVHAWRSG